MTHHAFLALAKATKLHEIIPDAKIGGMVTYFKTYPLTCKPENVFANQKAKELLNDFYYDVFVHGAYPSYVTSRLVSKWLL